MAGCPSGLFGRSPFGLTQHLARERRRFWTPFHRAGVRHECGFFRSISRAGQGAGPPGVGGLCFCTVVPGRSAEGFAPRSPCPVADANGPADRMAERPGSTRIRAPGARGPPSSPDRWIGRLPGPSGSHCRPSRSYTAKWIRLIHCARAAPIDADSSCPNAVHPPGLL
jgi:hypothetical protein